MLYLPCPTIHQHFSSSYTLPTATEVTSHPKGPQKIANMDNNFLMPNKLPERATGNQSPSPGRRLGNRIKKIFRPNSHTAPPPCLRASRRGSVQSSARSGTLYCSERTLRPQKGTSGRFLPFIRQGTLYCSERTLRLQKGTSGRAQPSIQGETPYYSE